MKARCLKILEELVNQGSITSNAAGVERAQTIVCRELVSMGFRVQLMPNPMTDIDSADLVVAELPGASDRFVTLVSHADTVLGVDSCGRFRVDGERGFGSGVIDNKGGLVVALEALRLHLWDVSSRPPFSLRLVSSPNEEGGSLGFHEAYERFSKDSVMVLGFEPALENGSIIESRRGNRWYQIRILGQEAHAGRCRGEQINAAHEAALKIARLIEMNDASAGASLNVGQVQGGRDRFNIVCGEVRMKLDVRFPSFEIREKLHTEILRVLETSFVSSPVTGRASQTSFKIVDDCPPFSNTPASAPFIDLILNSIATLEGVNVRSEKAGGAGDVNYMSREGVVVIDGLGPVGGLMHTPEEFVNLPTLASRAAAVAALLEQAPALLG